MILCVSRRESSKGMRVGIGIRGTRKAGTATSLAAGAFSKRVCWSIVTHEEHNVPMGLVLWSISWDVIVSKKSSWDMAYSCSLQIYVL